MSQIITKNVDILQRNVTLLSRNTEIILYCKMYSNTYFFFNIFQNVPNATELPVSHNLVCYNETQSLLAQYLLCQKTWCFYTTLDQKCRTDDLFPSLHLHLSFISTWYTFFSLSLFIWHNFFYSVWHRLWILCLFFQFLWLLECHIILQLEKKNILYRLYTE